MLRNLPEGSRFAAAMAVENPWNPEDIEAHFQEDPRRDAINDHRTWDTDRCLQATAINALYTLIATSRDWGKEGPPDFPVIGPAAWQPAKQKTVELKDNYDVLRKMGWNG
jgi:hypothetical protein